MPKLWVICGAGRGVGKTTLAEKLCSILPGSVYAKCGHGKQKIEKSANFFTSTDALEQFIASQKEAKHIVVESNAYAASGNGDIVIFIDGVTGKTDFRDDAPRLCSRAQIVISRDASRADWMRLLKKSISRRNLSAAICDALTAQKNYLFGSQPKVRTKVWLDCSGARVFGNGLAKILENVDRLETLQSAAHESGMSYRYAWNLIRDAEKYLGKKLVDRHTGGSAGGSSILSDEGRHMLKMFQRLNRDVAEYADKKFSEFYKDGINA